MMKLTSFLLLISFMQVSAALYSQDSKVSIQVKECPIEQVFELIENQSSYVFVYNHEQVKNVGRVTCLKGSGLYYEFVDNTIVIRWGQEDKKFKTIRGKVMDRDSVPLPGVTVKMKGTTIGTASDMHGKFE